MTGYNKQIDVSVYFKLVKQIAYHVKGSLPDKFELEDLSQTGMMGLIEARDSFSEKSGVPFEAYARMKIRGAMIDSVRKDGDKSRGFSKQSKAIYEAERRYEELHGCAPEETELARELEIPLEKLQKFYQEANSMRFLSVGEDIELSSEETDFDKAVLIDRLKPALKILNEQELMVISLYFAEEMNLREIKEILDISEPRIHQIKGKALAKIKGFMLSVKIVGDSDA